MVGKKRLSSGEEEVVNNLFTPPLDSIANQNTELTSIKKNILRELKNSGSHFTVRGCANALNCHHKNIQYHLEYLRKLGYVEKTAKYGVWKITNEGLKLFMKVANRGLSSGEEEVVNKGCRQPVLFANEFEITKHEQEILDLFTKDFLTPKEIANKRKTSKEAVNKVLRKLRNKGVLSKDSSRKVVANKGLSVANGTSQPLRHNTQYIRLHAMQYQIQLLKQELSSIEQFELDNNIVKLWKNSIEIYSQEGLSFIGRDSQSATNKAMLYWNNFIKRLENKLSIIILEDGYAKINLVKCEYEEVHNEVAKELRDVQKKLRLYTKEGKLWGYIDYSFDENCFETCKGDTAKHDMEKVATVFNDIRDNSHRIFVPSEVTQVLGQITTHLNLLQNQVHTINKELGASQKISIEMFNNLIQIISPTRPKSSSGDDDRKYDPSKSSMFM